MPRSGAASKVAEIEGKSQRMLDVYKLVAHVAPASPPRREIS